MKKIIALGLIVLLIFLIGCDNITPIKHNKLINKQNKKISFCMQTCAYKEDNIKLFSSHEIINLYPYDIRLVHHKKNHAKHCKNICNYLITNSSYLLED